MLSSCIFAPLSQRIKRRTDVCFQQRLRSICQIEYEHLDSTSEEAMNTDLRKTDTILQQGTFADHSYLTLIKRYPHNQEKLCPPTSLPESRLR